MEQDDFRDFLPTELMEPDRRSGLVKAKEKAKNGQVVNGCLKRGFGCTDAEIWANGLCRHVVGFTLPGDDTLFEPVKMRDKQGPGGTMMLFYSDGNDIHEVQPTDKLVLISVSSRVYRDVDKYPVEWTERVKAMTPKKVVRRLSSKKAVPDIDDNEVPDEPDDFMQAPKRQPVAV